MIVKFRMFNGKGEEWNSCSKYDINKNLNCVEKEIVSEIRYLQMILSYIKVN